VVGSEKVGKMKKEKTTYMSSLREYK